MFVANYGLKSIVQKAAMAVRLPISYAQDHPYTGLKERARRETLDYIMEAMPDALAFDTPRELMRHALSRVSVDGLFAEFGVNEAGTISFIAKQKPECTIHGFDSFEGLPEDWAGNAMAAGYFNRKGRLPKTPSNVVLHPGWFNVSAPKFAAENQGSLAFLHVDCDLYSSTVTIFEALGDRIVPGTVIMFDEYFNYPNWKAHEHKAFEEFKARSGAAFRPLGYAFQQIAVVAM
ncbi:MAG: TylF/MycF/NovP-related O-methyltransferase [Hyphomicrobium sp.]